MLTPWGYEIVLAQGQAMPDLMTVEQFNAATGNRFASNDSLSIAIAAASSAIRNHCGWHVAPALTCKVKTWGGGAYLFTPWMAMSAVSSVTQNGVALDSSAYDWKSNGVIRRTDGFFFADFPWNTIEVTATAGYETIDPLLQQVIVQLVGNALAAPLGVREEHAGNVGITYNQTGSGMTGGVTLTARDEALLEAYVKREAV